MDNTELQELLEAWARQKLVADQAQETLNTLTSAIKDAYGDREDGLFSDNAHVARKKGNRKFKYQQAAMSAGIPPEKFKLYARPISIDWKRMCEQEGIDQDDIPFTRGDDTVKVTAT